MVDRQGAKEAEGHERRKSRCICRNMALESHGGDYQHQRQLRGLAGRFDNGLVVGCGRQEDWSGRLHLGVERSFQDLSLYLCARDYLVDG